MLIKYFAIFPCAFKGINPLSLHYNPNREVLLSHLFTNGKIKKQIFKRILILNLVYMAVLGAEPR